MAAELDEIASELGLPQFRVPAPHNSAQHAAATAYHPRDKDGGAALPMAGAPAKTRRFTPGMQAVQPARPPTLAARSGSTRGGSPVPARQFAGIDIDEFGWARQRGRRAVVLWTLAVLVLTAAVAGAAWNLGLNLPGLIGR